MLRSLIPILILFTSLFSYGQKLHPLEHSNVGKVSFEFGGTNMNTDKNLLNLLSEFEIEVKGSTEKLTIDSLLLYNIDFSSADIELYLSRCLGENEYESKKAGAYFITIGFYDVDSRYIMGHSLVINEGFSLARAKTNLQADVLKAQKNEENCFNYYVQCPLAIHHAFLYSERQTAGNIKPIRLVQVQAFHLGAG